VRGVGIGETPSSLAEFKIRNAFHDALGPTLVEACSETEEILSVVIHDKAFKFKTRLVFSE
jgi:hypothetical protein